MYFLIGNDLGLTREPHELIPLHRMHKEVEAFLRYISPTYAEDEVRGLVVELIAKAVTQEFPDAKVHPFGSFETKLYLPSGYVFLLIISSPSHTFSI
jgi:non-canonical poly(A) RNA polymerase PAPD5/7